MSVSCGLLVWYCCEIGSICGSKPRNGGYLRRRPKSATQGLANMRCAAVMMFSFRAQVACAAPRDAPLHIGRIAASQPPCKFMCVGVS